MADFTAGQDTKQKIYDTARRLFYQRGYLKTTLAAISQESGINSAMVSYYFDSKANLALAVFAEYMQDTKNLVGELLPSVSERSDLMFQTAVEVRVHVKNMQSFYQLGRFLHELNQTSFYLKRESITTEFFERLSSAYDLNISYDKVCGITVTNYAIMASLIAARYEGVLDLTNADLARIIVTQYAHALGFFDAEIKDLIDSSYDAFRKMSIHVGDNFTLISG